MVRPEKRCGYIYFLLSDKHNALKIGFTRNNLKQRLKDYFTHTPYDYDVLGAIKGTMMDERILHRRFVRYKIRGEWFNYSDELREYVEKVILENAYLENISK